jgi:hypothetical protein
MRVQIYDEEVTGDIEVIVKENVLGEDGKPTTFFGLRLYLESSDKLHQTEFDDDRSAVTFWYKEEDNRKIRDTLAKALLAIHDAGL